MSKAEDRVVLYRERINRFLEKCLPDSNTPPAQLHEAMRYVVLSAGKRIRAALVYAAGEAFGVELSRLDHLAAVVELIHAYSLVHDDLPAMDDDDLRRGKPTCHKAFNEAIAILTGDALQTLAFAMLAQAPSGAENRVKMLAVLTDAIGSMGMAGGQALDLAAEGKMISLVELENIHALKTGKLITASVQLGALASGEMSEKQLDALTIFAQNLGLVFQVQDDILDLESDTETLGKPQGADLKKNKSTYPALLGMAAAKEKLAELYKEALTALKQADLTDSALQQLTEVIISRRH